MRPRTAAIAAAAALFAAALALPGSASAADGCITRAEYRALVGGETVAQVQRKVGATGRVTFERQADQPATILTKAETIASQRREFRKCRSFDGGRGKVGVFFFGDAPIGEPVTLRVVGKSRFVARNANYETGGIEVGPWFDEPGDNV